MNTRKTIGFGIGLVIWILIMTIVFQYEVSYIQGAGEVSGKAKEFKGSKIAGSFRLLERGETFGKVSFSDRCSIKAAGFSKKPELKAASAFSEDKCKLPEETLRLLYNVKNKEGAIIPVEVGS